MGQTATTGHLDTLDTSSSTATGALCPETEVLLGGPISLDTQRESILLTMIYVFIRIYLFRDGAVLCF